VAGLNAAYGLTAASAYESFEAVEAPIKLPADGLPVRDWFQFEALVLPIRAAAHRFTVLLPVPIAETDGSDELDEERRRELVKRIVGLQKPAHTVFDVRFYWAAFRIGEARLELDTLIDLGSRSPRLIRPSVLGRAPLGETYLGGDLEPRLTAPPSIDRDPLGR
jgi:hypothetical protein